MTVVKFYRIQVEAGNSSHLLRIDSADPFRVQPDVVRIQVEEFRLQQKSGQVGIGPEIEDEVSGQVFSRQRQFLLRGATLDEALDLPQESAQCGLAIRRRGADVGEEPSGIEAGGSRQVAVGGVGETPPVPELPGDPGC